jgi:ATP-dependent exoDNAse (exonuclease V) beta subunit
LPRRIRYVTVVGDAKQSIYGRRDAEIDNIRHWFRGGALTHNRRSSGIWIARRTHPA